MADAANSTPAIALATVPGWSGIHLARLKQSWIDTAEQVVAVANTSGGLESLANQIGATQQETGRLVEAARNSLSPTKRIEMEEEVDTSQFGLGVIFPGSR